MYFGQVLPSVGHLQELDSIYTRIARFLSALLGLSQAVLSVETLNWVVNH
jgi:hypothetical protein